MFFRGSRYEPVPTAEITTADGRTIRYKRVRFVPAPAVLLFRRVGEGERLDLIAYELYRDPEQFWRICDANRAFRPDTLTEEPGRILAIPVQTS
jgi:hypothetical protein